MIDPLVSLAFSVYANPGVFGLLLGSGLSRSAGIPTGWEIVQDLIRKLATLEGQDPTPDPAEWYRSAHGAVPNYSDLLGQLARTPDERSQLLRTYFEPTVEERERGVKIPTTAHRAIAELAKAGYVRVMITTNFDRLLETALVDAGVQPVVITTADSIKGALPLPHVRSLVLKVNGDYLDMRIKNTEAELSSYDPSLNMLLDRLFDEFGLVVCGWSGDWDIALRAAIERSVTRRFSMYWTTLGSPTPKASDLITARGAVVIPIASADNLFLSLKEKVAALAEFGQGHPLSARLAAVQAKRYIVGPEHRILLHDLVMDEVERSYSSIDPNRFHANPITPVGPELGERLRGYETLIQVPLAIIIAGAQWGSHEHHHLWQYMLRRLADVRRGPGNLTAWLGLRLYPAALLMYAGGIAALLGRQYGNLAAILRAPITVSDEHGTYLAAEGLNVAQVMPDGLVKYIPGMETRHTPFSDHVFEALREPFRQTIPADAAYEEAFLLFEYLMSLVVLSVKKDRAPVGRTRWRRPEFFTPDGPTGPLRPHIQAIANALFPEGIKDYAALKAFYDLWVAKVTPSWG